MQQNPLISGVILLYLRLKYRNLILLFDMFYNLIALFNSM